MKKIILFYIVLGVWSIFLPQTSAAATLTVCASGCDHTTIQAAIAAASVGDTISVLDPVHTEAGIVVNKDLTIQGQGENNTIVQAADTPMTASDRVFTISSGVTATIQDMTIRHGFADEGGGLLNEGTLTLASGTVSDNFSMGGGGTFNRGTLTVTDSTFSGNDSLEGGGLWNVSGTMELIDCIVSGNYADITGGGISNTGGILTLINSTVSGNDGGDAGGGGIINRVLNDGSVLILINSTISDNNASGGIGGGIWNASGTTTVTNTTVSGNCAFDEGDGILNSDMLTMINSTVSGNCGPGFENFGTATIINSTLNDGLAYCSELDTVSLSNSIISGCGVSEICIDPEEKPIISNGYNLDRDENCIDTPAIGDQIGVDPLLGPLQDNGGPTKTQALLPGSPAIDAIPEEACIDPDGNPLTTDQRGVSRPQGSACDIGAYEYVVDTDGDGIPDDEDDCPNSDLSKTVVIDGCDSGVPNTLFDDGCTISDNIADLASTSTSHGNFTSSVSHYTNDLKKEGIITGQQKGAIQRCAGQADIP